MHPVKGTELRNKWSRKNDKEPVGCTYISSNFAKGCHSSNLQIEYFGLSDTPDGI
jgi:hypothetical protein